MRSGVSQGKEADEGVPRESLSKGAVNRLPKYFIQDSEEIKPLKHRSNIYLKREKQDASIDVHSYLLH